MAQVQGAEATSAEVLSWLLQAKAFLDDARQLKPGPARDELREVAKVLREIARLEAQSGLAAELDRPTES